MSKTGRTWAGGVQVESQGRFMRLIAQGVNNSEACRRVGIGHRTGERWRSGHKEVNMDRGGRAPSAGEDQSPQTAEPRYLSEHARIAIADLLRTGATVRAIGLELDRPPSTVSRGICPRTYKTPQAAQLLWTACCVTLSGFVTRSAPRSGTESDHRSQWVAARDGILAFAASKGWANDDGETRARVELATY